MTATQRRPNVIIFMTDQQRWDTTGLAGCPLDLTPNLDRLGHAGTVVVNAVTPQPVCAPARAALQTGHWPTQSGVYRNGIPLPSQERTIAHRFAAAGYETALIGKWHLARTDPVPRAEQSGYEYWLGANLPEFTSDGYHTRLYDRDGSAVDLPGYRADALTDAAIRFVTQRDASRPFFLFVSLLEPHHQNNTDSYPAPVGYAERYHGRWMPPDLAALEGSAAQHLGGYYGQVKRVDECLGRLWDSLFSLGLVDDTVLLYTADHGCHFKTRNGEYKRSCHDVSVRVPMVLSGPCFQGGGRVDEPVSLLDVVPTLCDAAEIAVDDQLAGRSLLDILRSRGRRQPAQWRDDVLIQISESQVGRALRTRRWKYAVVARDADGWHDADATTYTEDALYDLDNDPYELDNLVGYDTYGPVLADLRPRLVAAMEAAGEKPPTILPAPSAPAGQRNPDYRAAAMGGPADATADGRRSADRAVTVTQ